MSVQVELLIILSLILINGVFATAEVAMIYARKVRLRQRASRGERRARIALRLASEPERFLSTVQIGITLIGIVTGVFGGATISRVLAGYFRRVPVVEAYADPLGYGAVVLALTYLTLVLGELVPKTLALKKAEPLAIALAPPMALLSRLAAPAVGLLTVSTNLVLRLLGAERTAEPALTEDELRHFIQQATQSGVLIKGEQDLVERMLFLGDRQVTAFMTPRTEIEWIDLEDSPEENWRKIAASPVFSFPVCRGSLDDLLGVAMKDRLFEQYLRDRSCRPETVMDTPLLVPEGVTGLRAIELMKNVHRRVAVVMDEYGGVGGLVTLSDFVSVVFFGTRARAEADEPLAVERPDGSWLLSGPMPVEEFLLLFRIRDRPTGTPPDIDTLGGLVMNGLGRIPAVGDSIETFGLRLEVLEMDARRVDKLRVSWIEPPAEDLEPREHESERNDGREETR